MSTSTAHTELSSYSGTKKASYVAFIVQAINNNIAPLLFVVFHFQFNIPIAQLGLLAALNFGVQLLTDVVAMFVVDKIGYRKPIVIANALSALGLALLAVLPMIMDPFAGICIAIIIYAMGGGLIEVLASPIIEHLPTPKEAKASSMAMLHSFYCWGQLLVVVVTTLLIAQFGREHWMWLPLMWAVIPLINTLIFARVPLPQTVAEDQRMSLKEMVGTPLFLSALVLMLTGGAAELTMVQWSSFFAEQGIGVSKETGDLLGIGLFSILMGVTRFSFGIWGHKLDLAKLLMLSSFGAGLCYIVAATSSVAIVSLLACALCGMMIALLWPGTMSLTAARFPYGAAAMFGVLALAGDAGGTLGPAAVGVLADFASGPLSALAAVLPGDNGSGLRTGILLSAIVPFVFTYTVWRFSKNNRTNTVDLAESSAN